MKAMYTFGLTASLVFAALASTSAGAATWTYSGTGAINAGGLTATTTAYSAANSTTATITATTAYYGSSWGLGVTSSGESSGDPQHTIDNNGPDETVMIAFSDGVSGLTAADKVKLSSVTFGYASGDSDFSVYAYTGTGVANPLGLTYSNLTSNGWTLIGHYDGGNTGTTDTTYNLGTSIYSSHWLVGAYNGLGSGLDKADDFFKLASVTGMKCPTTGTIPAGCNGGGNPGGVPEPGTLLLMGAGLLGLTRMSRRKSA